jgi:hypothetical protein
MYNLTVLLAPLASGKAYLDPGSGSILLQILIGGLLGLGFILRAFWGRIRGFFRRSKEPENLTQEDE